MPPSWSDYEWLVGEDARPWLHGLQDVRWTPALMARLRRELSPERASLVVAQSELRQKARRKFTIADQLFFESVALEQATDETIATYKASLFSAGTRVADLCCGIGGDAMSLSQTCALLAVELNPVRALLAEANLRRCGSDGYRVLTGDALQVPLADLDAWHLDPDRRADGRRTTQTDQMVPTTDQMAHCLSLNERGMVKVAPATRIPDPWRTRAEQEWIGHSRQCQQQLWRFGSLARYPGKRVATLLFPSANEAPWHVVEESTPSLTRVTHPGAYLIEPQAAVIAAGLADQVACQAGMHGFSSRVPYYSADAPYDRPTCACYAVLTTMPFDERRVRQWLRRQDACIREIKKRGVDFESAQLAQRLATAGNRAVSLIVFPTGRGVVAVLAERYAAAAAQAVAPRPPLPGEKKNSPRADIG